jgi:hypothetical protein
MEPTILRNVLFDSEKRIFYCDAPPEQPYRIFETELPFLPNSIYPENVLEIEEPTYMRTYYHSCFGHAYVDETFPLLSILYEYNPDILEQREFRLFVLKDTFSEITQDAGLQAALKLWDDTYIDYKTATYREPYKTFHECFSKYPVLFEKGIQYHYIRFKTLIFGGNDDFQRAIHNSAARYPGRRVDPPIATDTQIRKWVGMAKVCMGNYLKISQTPGRTLLIARKGARGFTGELLSFLQFAFDTEAVYLEEYSLKEQIELFQSATTIVAAHGSGLCHCIWSKPGTRIVELFAGKDPRAVIFKSYAEFLDLDYTAIELSDKVIIADECMDIDHAKKEEVLRVSHI